MNKINNSFVSVAIPAYKKEFLKETIDSVLAQSHSDFELIIVNDCSPENLDEIVNQYKDTRIRYYKNEVNLGKESIVHNWNKCLSYAKGEYFALLCDDDIMEATFLEEMLELASKYPEVNVFRSRTQYFNTINGNIIYETSIWPEYETFESYIDNLLSNKRKHTISEFLYRTKYIKSCNGYIVFPAGYYSDIASIITFTQEGGIVSTSKPLIRFRKSDINISSNNRYNIEKVKSAFEYYHWLKTIITKNNIQYNIEEKRKYDIYTYYISSNNIIDAFKILILVPSYIWNIQTKIVYLYNWVRTNPLNLLK